MKQFVLFALLMAAATATAERVPYLPFDEDPFRVDYESAGDYELFDLIDSAREAVAEKDWPRTTHLYGELKRRDSKEPEYLYAMTQLAYLLNLWDEALTYADDVPDGYEEGRAELIRGASLLQLRRTEEALAIFQEQLRKAPDSSEVRRWMAASLVALHRYEEAAQMYRDLLAADPAALDGDPELKQAIRQDGAGGPERASQRLKEVTQARLVAAMLPPMQAATVHYLLGNRNQAYDIMKEAIANQPDDGELYYRLALFYDHAGKKEEALPYVEQAVARSPGNADLVNNLGVIAMQLGRYQQAVESFLRAIELRPDFAEAFRNVARVYFQQEEWGKVIHAARESLILEPDSTTARMMAAYAALRLKYHEDVLQFLTPMMEADTKLADAWFMAGTSARDLGRTSQAESCFRHGLALDGRHAVGLNNLADLILAERDPTPERLREALTLAEQASTITGGRNAVVEQTLKSVRERVDQLGSGTPSGESAPAPAP